MQSISSSQTIVKAFPSLHEAQAFVDGKALSQASSKQPSEQKFYAVQRGKKPGVYTDWPSAQAQIQGFRGPKHKKFTSRAEAEAFVAADKQKNLSFDPSQTLSPEEEIRQLIVRNSAPGLVTNGIYQPKDKDGNPYELGTGPLPPGAEDSFDPNIKLSEDGIIVQKSIEEKNKTKMMLREKDPPGMLRIYTDGSSLRNGQAGARAGIGVFFGPQDPKYATSPPPTKTQTVYTIDWVSRGAPTPPSRKQRKLTNWRYRNVSEALKGSKQTNQRAELTAIQRALDIAPRHRDVTIYTDSRYSIDCVTDWYRNWERNEWRNKKGKPVENKDVIAEVRSMIVERESLGKQTFFVWVKGHASDEGNVQADRLAVDGARAGSGVGGEGSGSGSDVEDDESTSASEQGVENGVKTENVDDDGELNGAFEEMERAMAGTGDEWID